MIDAFSWEYCQVNSDRILMSAVQNLSLQKHPVTNLPLSKTSGNYLILYQSLPVYIGESLILHKRIKQQFGSNSTFYKTYQKNKNTPNIPQNLEVLEFEVNFIETKVGRKEVEEFGIVNLETSLNKFQLGKRDKIELRAEIDLWQKVQDCFGEIIIDGANAVFNAPSLSWYEAELPPDAGLYYVLHSTDGLIYIGESSNIKSRYKTHSTDTRFSAFRRHIGVDLLKFQLKTKSELGQISKAAKDKKMYLSDAEDLQINGYLENCIVKFLPIKFGRMELEEYLIKQQQPLLNRKSKT